MGRLAIHEMFFMERRCVLKYWSGASPAEHLLQQREKRKYRILIEVRIDVGLRIAFC